MADPRFFYNSGPISLNQIKKLTGVEIRGREGPDREFTDVQPLQNAGPDHVSFLDNNAYREALRSSEAGACILRSEEAHLAPSGMILLVTPQPYHVYAKLAAEFYDLSQIERNISDKAIIDTTAKIGKNCSISPGVIIEKHAELGENCIVEANAVIGRGCCIGNNTFIGMGATISYALVGSDTTIHHGVRIGGDGFGFALGKEFHTKVPQLGRVIIGDNVEIGANTTVDRGTGPDTIISDQVKIDNLVQIAHNVEIGKGCVIVAQAGVSGSSSVGDFSLIGGQAGIAGHLKIGPGAQISGQSGVMRNVESNSKVFGTPAKPSKIYFREINTLSQLSIKRAEKK